MKLQPFADKIIVKADDPESKTPGGIIVPDVAKQKPRTGRVLAVGEGRFFADKKELIPMRIKEGQRVVFSEYGASKYVHEGEELLILSQEDIFATLA